MLEAPKLGSRVAHDMHSRAGADYGELLLEAKEVDDSAIGLMPRGTAARTPALLAGGRWLSANRYSTVLIIGMVDQLIFHRSILWN